MLFSYEVMQPGILGHNFMLPSREMEEAMELKA